VYHGSKPEARHQLVAVIDEAAVGIRNEFPMATLNGTKIGSMHTM
jgi:hypothetical protein